MDIIQRFNTNLEKLLSVEACWCFFGKLGSLPCSTACMKGNYLNSKDLGHGFAGCKRCLQDCGTNCRLRSYLMNNHGLKRRICYLCGLYYREGYGVEKDSGTFWFVHDSNKDRTRCDPAWRKTRQIALETDLHRSRFLRNCNSGLVDGFLPIIGAIHYFDVHGLRKEFPRFLEDFVPYMYEIDNNLANYVRVIANLNL